MPDVERRDNVRQDDMGQDTARHDGVRQDGPPQDGMGQDAGMGQDDVRQEHAVPQHTLAAPPLPVDEPGPDTGRHTTTDGNQAEEHAAQRTTPDQGAERGAGHDSELFTGDTVTRLRARWRELQADFVDDPQRAVREADEVVDEVLRTITEHRERLAGEWHGQTDTEHLRLAMREYRTFVDRLLPTT